MSGACMCDAVRPSGPLGNHRTSAPLMAAYQRARQRTRREARSSQSGRRSRPGQPERGSPRGAGRSRWRPPAVQARSGRCGCRLQASRPGQGGRSPRFSYRIIRVLVACPSKVAQMKAARCCYMWVLERSESDEKWNCAVRKTRRAALLEVAGSTPPIPRPGGHQNATGLVITPTNHPGRWHITPAAYGAQWKPLAALLA